MRADIKWLDNPEVFRVNQIPAHSDHDYYLNYADLSKNKGIEFKVVDKELLKLTNGIVQGMSGSPIIQDGKIIGAVTHVLVNDPSKGYGIFIEHMLEH